MPQVRALLWLRQGLDQDEGGRLCEQLRADDTASQSVTSWAVTS